LPLAYFIDENMLAVGHALASVREDVVYPGHRLLPEVPRGTLDVDWLPVIGAGGRNLVVFTRDKGIRRKAGEALALKDHGVRMFVLTGKDDLTSWEKLELLVRSWRRIEKSIASNGPGPWVQKITNTAVSDLVLW